VTIRIERNTTVTLGAGTPDVAVERVYRGGAYNYSGAWPAYSLNVPAVMKRAVHSILGMGHQLGFPAIRNQTCATPALFLLPPPPPPPAPPQAHRRIRSASKCQPPMSTIGLGLANDIEETSMKLGARDKG
jgi:hypothetical protein